MTLLTIISNQSLNTSWLKQKNSQVYFVNLNDDYCESHLDHVEWSAFKNLSAVEKIAQQHGFITEMVKLEFEVPLTNLKRDGYSYGDSKKMV